MWKLLSSYVLPEYFTIDVGYLMILGFAIFFVGLSLWFNINHKFISTFFFFVMLLGIAFLIEMTIISPNDSCCDDQNGCFQTSIQKYPIEYREETNQLYVFIDGELQKLTDITSEYAEKNDTLYRLKFEKIENNISTSSNLDCFFVKRPKVQLIDSLKEKQNKKNQKIPLIFDKETGEFIDTTNAQIQ